MKRSFPHIVLVCIFTLINLYSATLFCQNISGEKIDVSSNALTVLKFSAKITHFEFDDNINYLGQARNNDNSFAIRIIGSTPANTNLYVSEGKRGHWFVINYLAEDIDLNKVKLYHDFSDLKDLKKLVAAERQMQEEALAKSNNVAQDKAQMEKIDKLSKDAAKDSIAFQKAEDERLAQRREELKKQQAIEDAKHALFITDSIHAKQVADARLAKAREDALRTEKIEKAKRAQATRDSLLAKNAVDAQLAKEIEQAKKQQALEDARIAKAKKDSVAAKNAAEALAVKVQLDSLRVKKRLDDAIAKAKADAITQENERKAEMAKALEREKKEQEIAAAKAAKDAELLRQQELQRIAAIHMQRIKDSIAALPKVYTREELRKKYPKIVFENPPVGQSLAADYFLVPDTVENSRVSYLILDDKIAKSNKLNLYSNTEDHIFLTLQSIHFSGVNCYMRILISNKNAKDDYLVGVINLKWEQYEGKSYNLYPCFVTGFPVLSHDTEREIVLVTRTVNIKDEDMITLTIGDRLNTVMLELPLTGKLYNELLVPKDSL